MKISKFTVNPIAENTYIIWDGEGSDAAIIDPGMMSDEERKAVDDFVEKNKLKMQMVLMTHLHFDHAASARYIADKYGIKVYANVADKKWGDILHDQARMLGATWVNAKLSPLKIDAEVNDGDVLKLNGEDIKVLATPGHTPGGVSYYLPESGAVFVGDTLFCQSVGRTDLPGGSFRQIVGSITTKLFSLPDETMVLPGHGVTTKILDERSYNPYIR